MGEGITDADFLSWREKRPRKEYDDECKACGVSVNATIEGAQETRRRSSRLRNRVIAEGALGREHGEILPTTSQTCDDHLTWWPLEGIDRKAPFQMIEES